MDDRYLILVVEDDPDIASALRRGLSAQGYRSLPAADTATAMRVIAEHAPAAAIVDVMIGDDSGLDLTRRTGPARQAADAPAAPNFGSR